MSDREDTMTVGLLLESAHAQQRLAQQMLEALKQHTASLDAVTRDEIRQVFSDELQLLDGEVARLVRNFARAGRHHTWRAALLGIAVTAICSFIPLGVARWVLPSSAQIAELKAERNDLTRRLQLLTQQGGRVELRHCGEAARLCVRIDEHAPRYGERADFHVLAGY